MSNCEVFTLPVVEVELHQVREVLRCALHTIIFNRALGHVTPRDVDSELFDITYVNCGDPDVNGRVEARITDFCGLVERRAPSQGGEAAQLVLSFYETRRRTVGWFGAQDERLYWEQWVISIVVVTPEVFSQDHHSLAFTNARALRRSRLQAGIEELLATVVRLVNDKKDHIPPVVSSSTVTFPFDISIAGGSRLAFGLNTVKRMLLQASPPPVLG